MKKGLYEKLLKDMEIETIGGQAHTRMVDNSEVARVISLDSQKILRKVLEDLDPDGRIGLVEELYDFLQAEGVSVEDNRFKEVLAYHDQDDKLQVLQENRPLTSLASTSLLTGGSGPSLESELKKEILTSDKADFLVSFIKFSGYRLLMEALREFTKTRKLRIITTSYMGASDYKAILELSKLPNTEVKISYDVKRTRLHAKSYYFERETGFSTAYIGSSNLSNAALTSGLEWNLKISEYTSRDAIEELKKTFEIYWNDKEFVTFDPSSKDHRRVLRHTLDYLQRENDDQGAYTFFDLRPYPYQKEILEDLSFAREEKNSYRNLIVAATGTGKTMVSAFDYKKFRQEKPNKSNLLFLAHRQEILKQSINTFRNVLRDQNFGELWVGDYQAHGNENLFASIQTLTTADKYKNFPADHFDYIILDESHHAAAGTYLKLLDYFRPKILLGLTATPERMDNIDISSYFDNRIASEIRLDEAINRKLLSPFHYFGVSDPEDLSKLKWTRGGYEISQLDKVYTKSKQRVQVIIDSLDRYLADMENFKALGFCVSVDHAEFMAKSFNKAGIKSYALTSQSPKEDRNRVIQDLKSGQIKCIFTVDLFNEGVDIPEIDTVLFLRPTESLTVFIQQLGRGLRLSPGKEVLTVLDYVGQAHQNYNFGPKYRALIGRTKGSLYQEIVNEFPSLPAGCHIELEKEAMDHILNNISLAIVNKRNIIRMIQNFQYNSMLDLDLKNFLDHYSIAIEDFYSKNFKFYDLVHQAGKKDKWRVTNTKDYNTSLYRVSVINSKQLISFARRVLEEDLDYRNLSLLDQRKLSMLYYTIWTIPPETSFQDSFNKLKNQDPDLVKEILEILDYNEEKLSHKEITYEDGPIPLDIYASYTVDQIAAAVGKTTEDRKHPIREGVFYLEDLNMDIFFITINKNEEDYLPTTMYRDYAINSKYFNWESQSTTSVTSPTGQRYISQAEDHKVLIFVREEKKINNNTRAYTFLGPAKYKSHKGTNPIEIIWEMENPIPEKIIRQSNLMLAK